MKDYGISLLADFYAECLNERALQIVRWYYDEDLSLTEISEALGISKQGVSDYLNKATATMCDLEEKLHLREKYEKTINKINEYTDLLRIENNFNNDNIIEMLENIKKEI